MEKCRSARTVDEQEVAEARNYTLLEILYDVTARAVTTRAGQFIYKCADNVLWTVEQTARWSLPQAFPTESHATDSKSTNDSGRDVEKETPKYLGSPLIRPLPWMLFLPALIYLRMLRNVLSISSRLIGRGPFLPSNMVGFIQSKRRKLRALKYRGQRLERISKIESATWLKRIVFDPLKTVICVRSLDLKGGSNVEHLAVVRKHRHEINKKRNNHREAESDEDAASGNDSWEDASCQELLEKYAHIVEDSSFNVDDIASCSDCADTSTSDTDHSPEKNHIVNVQLQISGKKSDKIRELSKTDTTEIIKTNIEESTIQTKISCSSSKFILDPDEQKHINAKEDVSPTKNISNEINKSNTNPKGTEQEQLQNNKGLPIQTNNSSSSSKPTIDLEENTHTIPREIVLPTKINPAVGSPENNENKPINQNIGTVTQPNKATPTSNSKLPSKNSSNALVSDLRNNLQQHKPTKQQSAPQLQNPTKEQSSFSNGGKNRNKKTSTGSIV
ncbi:uncharacterized protein LOC118465308 isoform X2 [Anopheles albimanus]|uniref:uncharacterized protein LOC118465308 isoform X2 n=1 Tax=Anopheles albimanus TaxID=7167 RepID=UPI00164209E4|nr:uncharacterized protein LOC118465308 isoform X2 [Anopheles albimanus]